MINEASLKNLENLHRLKNEGVITQEDFDQAKAKLFSEDSAPTYRQPFRIRVQPGSPLASMVEPLNRYFDFNGRSGRQEFWMFVFGQAVFYTVLALLIGHLNTDDTLQGLLSTFCIIAAVAGFILTFIPNVTVQVRRFHDQDFPAWMICMNLIPYIGTAIVLVFMCLDGTNGPNRFGPDPKQSGENQ